MQIMTSSAVAVKLLGANSSQVGFQPQANAAEAFSQASTRYVEATPEITGVYSDPRVVKSAKEQPSLAQSAINGITETYKNEFSDFKVKAKAGLEAALGRSLGESETFQDLGSYTRSKLPKDVLEMSRSAFFADFALGMAASQLKKLNLDNITSFNVFEGILDAGTPQELRGLDMSNAEDRQKAVDYAIDTQVRINLAGYTMAETDEVASDMMSKSLENAGVTDIDDLKESYADLHRARFENGNFTVIFDGVEITNDTL